MAKSIMALIRSEKAKASLNQVIREVAPKSQFKITKSHSILLDECKNSTEKVGTVFIEFGFPLPELTKCISALREKSESKPEKIILIIGESDAKEDVLSEHLRLGFSGILSMPFSEASLNEVLKVSDELSMKGSFARLKVATGIQIKSMLEQNGAKFEASSVLKAVKNACKAFEKNNPGEKVEDIAQEYSKMEPKDRVGRNIKDFYKGASERVRKLVEGRGE